MGRKGRLTDPVVRGSVTVVLGGVHAEAVEGVGKGDAAGLADGVGAT